MVCELLDFRCWIVNEIVGSVFLTVLLAMVLYFIIASKVRLGFDTTIALIFPMIFILGLAFTGFSPIFAFSTILIGFMLSWIFNKIIGNR